MCVKEHSVQLCFGHFISWHRLFLQQHSSLTEAMILDTEAAVMANFEFLGQADVDLDDDEDMSDDLDDQGDDDQDDVKTARRKGKVCFGLSLK